ncbi:MAG: type II CAAX prenyl endopeptidase Rce1 family protein [Terriglobia bacterium]
MSSSISQSGIVPHRAARHVPLWAAALEILLVYAGILLYIWRWQFTHPHAWVYLIVAVLASHFAHRDTLDRLGLTSFEIRASARIILPLAAEIYVPVVILGFAFGKLSLIAPTWRTLVSFGGYFIWCAFQQYVAQSYFHSRLMRLTPNRHLSSLLVALLFGAAHIPNPILMAATTLGGFILAEVFARHRNIWPLALAQTVGGFLIAALSPASLIHNMRVGPGYFFFGLR